MLQPKILSGWSLPELSVNPSFSLWGLWDGTIKSNDFLQFQGMGSAGINVMVNVITADLVPLEKRAKYSGLVALSSAFGLCSGVLIGAVVSERATWRWYVDR